MRAIRYGLMAVTFGLIAVAGHSLLAQDSPERTGEKVGRKVGEAVGKVKRGVENVGEEIKEGFEGAKDKVNRLSVEARVYGRLHWDKSLNTATISLEIREGGIAVLKGSVPDDASKRKAGTLTLETVGVNQVVNDLAVESATAGATLKSVKPD